MTLRQIIIDPAASRIIAIYSSDADASVGIKQIVAPYSTLSANPLDGKNKLIAEYNDGAILSEVAASSLDTIVRS